MLVSSLFPMVEVFRDELDESPWFGFAVGGSDALFVMHKVSDRYDLDGYAVFRREDISSIEESFERRDLIHRALRIKKLSPSAPSSIDLSSMRSLMESAQAGYGVLVVSREWLDSDEVEVGRVRITSDDNYVLRWLSTNAEWNNDDRTFRYRDVTLVEFGAEYEQTLLQVALDRESEG
ncbi:MAG: hypothetical protein AABZ84_09175 [Pseudomonadota bacterium]